MVGLPAPELGAVAVRAEAVVALRQGEDHLAGGIGGLVVAGVGRAIEDVDRQALLRDGVGVGHGHGDRERHDDRGCFAAGERAVIGLTAPELGAVEVGPEAVVAQRQRELHLAGDIGYPVVACVTSS